LTLMLANSDILQKIDREKLMNDFVSRTDERRSVFGHIVF